MTRRKRRRARLCDEFPSVDVVAVLDSSRSFLMKPLITTFSAFSYPFTRRRLTIVQTAPHPAFKCAPCCSEQKTSNRVQHHSGGFLPVSKVPWYTVAAHHPWTPQHMHPQFTRCYAAKATATTALTLCVEMRQAEAGAAHRAARERSVPVGELLVHHLPLSVALHPARRAGAQRTPVPLP
jgi:hypothetical protein